MIVSAHYRHERQDRQQILKIIGASPILSINEKLCVFPVDKGHKNGAEYHVITENGIIHIYNQQSRKYITSLVARPAQLERYGVYIPQAVLNKAREHVNKGYNLIWWENNKIKKLMVDFSAINFFILLFLHFSKWKKFFR